MHRPSRYSITVAIILLYLIPVSILSGYSLNLMSLNRSWNLFSLGLMMAACGSIALFLMMSRWSNDVQKETVPSNLPENIEISEENMPEGEITNWQQKYDQLQLELTKCQEDIQKILQEKEHSLKREEIAIQELETYRNAVEEQLQHKERLLQESQHLGREQRSLIEKHQQQISILESKERDLHYELQTLLQLTSLDSSSPGTSTNTNDSNNWTNPKKTHDKMESRVSSGTLSNMFTPAAAKQQLQRCIDIATKMSGANYFGSSSHRSPDFPVDNYTLDLRRLFDTLGDEHNYMLMVYSQKENKVLFANGQVKSILGWTPDKFVQSCPEIIQEGQDEWKSAVSRLTISPEVQLQMSMKSKWGQDVPLQCHLGGIHTGLFRHHAIGVLYPLKD